MPRESILKPIDPAILDSHGDYKKYGFEPKSRRHTPGLQLRIDDNFKIFCVPHLTCVNFSIIATKGKIVKNGFVTKIDGQDSFKNVIRRVAEYLSEIGTKYTYASINLTSATGVSRVN